MEIITDALSVLMRHQQAILNLHEQEKQIIEENHGYENVSKDIAKQLHDINKVWLDEIEKSIEVAPSARMMISMIAMHPEKSGINEDAIKDLTNAIDILPDFKANIQSKLAILNMIILATS